MPNFNHGHYIGQSLEAMLGSSDGPVEVIVIDDASTDSSVSVIEGFGRRDSRVRLFRNARNMGHQRSVNSHLTEARGDYVFLASADDYVLPSFFERMMPALCEHPTAGLVTCNGRVLDEVTGESKDFDQPLCDKEMFLSPDALVEAIRDLWFGFPDYTCFIKRASLLEMGGIPEAMRSHAGVYMNYLAAFKDGVAYIPDCLVTQRRAPTTYAAREGRDRDGRIGPVVAILRGFKEEKSGEVFRRVKASTLVAGFRLDLFRAVWRHPEHRDYLSPLVVERALFMDAVGRGLRVAPKGTRAFMALHARLLTRKSRRLGCHT